MRKHVKGQHEGKTYDCKECDYKTKQKGNLNVHMMAAHESLEFTCSMCEYKTSDKWRLRYHKTIRRYYVCSNGRQNSCSKITKGH